MKVKELIEKLKEMNQEAPACLQDWNEHYSEPCVAETVEARQGKYWKSSGAEKGVIGPFVCIGVD